MTYLTTPIYYVNDAPHLGHAYTTVIADALARWHRAHGADVRLVTGTDEHGLKVQRAAQAAGVGPGELAERTAARFRAAWDLLGIGYDDFVRTTEKRHRIVVEHLLSTVYERGYVRLGRYDGRYCVGCEAYVDSAECPVHRRPTERVSEENYFFRLSALAGPLADWFDRCPDAVRPASRRNEALGLLRQGLRDFSISRTSIDWGVPLPWDPAHVAYVWFDALGAYLTGAGYPDPEPDRWWPAHHLIGKDILRFHTIYWPAILLAAGLAPPARVTVHGFLLARGEKISKSGLRGLPLDELVAEFGADGLRYHLLRDNPVGPDGDFSYEGLHARYNADLANTLGNLVARVTALVGSRCGGIGPAPAADSPLAGAAGTAYEQARTAWAEVAPAEALAATWRLVAATSSYVVAAEPWRLPAGSAALERVLGDALEALRIVAVLAGPAVPAAAAEIHHRLGLGPNLADAASSPADGIPLPDAARWGGYPGGLPVRKGAPLFPRR
ncbi:MAG TPA: methionine--tRNA ligase [Micromonosporaceae bacterium]|nr:methionine--tRNA ligase [Micromonosporaceae bacterium]